MKNQIASEIFSYVTSRFDWQEETVLQMWIEQNSDNTYVAVAFDPETNESRVMSSPRTSYQKTLLWVQMWCSSFSILPAFL